MRRFGWPTALAMSTLLSAAPAWAQEAPPLDSSTQAAIIDSVTATLNASYIFEATATRIDSLLHHNLQAGRYESVTTLQDFVSTLTADMMTVAHDGHLWVQIPPKEEFLRARGDSAGAEAERDAREAFENYGFQKVERLVENVGYLRLDGFADAARAGATAVAAMNFLAHCDALIIDLRHNGGGEPNMIQVLTSYFFEDPVHLNSFYVRETDATTQFWTQAQVSGPRMADTPIFVLTSSLTFSAAEEFSYNLRNLKRATLVGETTGGGAHPNRIEVFPDLNVAMSVPYGRAINPITHTNWEGVGVTPHIECPPDEALEVATREALRAIRDSHRDDEARVAAIAFAIDRLEALQNPAAVPASVLEKWTGTYGPRHLSIADGVLWYQRGDGPKLRLVPRSETVFYFEQFEHFRLEVETDARGRPLALTGRFRDGNTVRSEREKG